jgi:protocatechuate 3,4-dioxygenase beta subunit
MTWVQVGNPIATDITISINPANPAVGQAFTISGVLTDANGKPMPNMPVYIDCQQPNGTWSARANVVTGSSGHYTATCTGTVQGQYYYEAIYWGNGAYGQSTAVQEMAVGNVAPVVLTLQSNIANPAVNQQFTLSGKLTDANGKPLAGKEIDLYDSVIDGILYTQYTSSTGTYSFKISMPAAGNDIRFSVEFPGDTSYQYAITSIYMNIG